MRLKPADIVVLVKLLVLNGISWTYNAFSYEIGLSPSQVHAGIKRCLAAQLLTKISAKPEPVFSNIREFFLYALKYLSPPKRGELTRGMPTMWAAAPLKQFFPSQDQPPVWPDPDGDVRGYLFEPIHPSVVIASKKDAAVYEMFTLIDSLRDGRARERIKATELLAKQFKVWEK